MEPNSGIYIRVGRENKLLEEMTNEEREEWLKDLDRDGLIRIIHRLSDIASYYEKEYGEEEEE